MEERGWMVCVVSSALCFPWSYGCNNAAHEVSVDAVCVPTGQCLCQWLHSLQVALYTLLEDNWSEGETTVLRTQCWDHNVETTVSRLHCRDQCWDHSVETSVETTVCRDHSVETTASRLQHWDHSVETIVLRPQCQDQCQDHSVDASVETGNLLHISGPGRNF